ncbi:MAG: hypothetical protein Q9179_007687 [Wetmoreana sp. 5 TL-2023]
MAEAAAAVGLVASIASLIDLSAKVTTRLHDFTSKSSDVPETFRSLSTRLPLLTATLQCIQSQAEAGHLPEDVSRALNAVVDHTSEQIMTVQTSLSKILPSDGASKLERVLKALKSLAKEDKIQQAKSQLAIEYSYQVRDSLPETWVFWVHASSKAKIEEGYRRIAEATRLPGRDDPKVDILQLVRTWLCDESNGRWVTIVDNADDSSVLSDLAGANERQDILPESPNGSVLVTARSREAAFELVGNDEDILKVGPMSESYALALFRKKFQGEDKEEEILELLQHLDYMPLAISQAAAYIRQRAPRTTVSKYLKDFRRGEKDRASLLNVAVRDRRRDRSASNSILGTWQISFEYIRSDRPSAARLLSLMSFFDRQGIPEELITSRYKENKSTVDFEEDIKVLRSFSLVTLGIEKDVFEMHRLVQFATRKWLEQRQELERWKERYITIIADAFPPGKYENWNRCQMLFPHAELVMEYRPMDEGFLQPWAVVLSNAAWYTAEQGRYNDAEQMDRRALNGREKVMGKEHPDTLTSVSNLALVLRDQGKYEEAEQMNRRALDGREKVVGKEHPDTLTSVSNLASVLRRQGKYKEAEQMSRRALDGREKVVGKEHPFTLMSVSNLASVLQDQGKYEEAEQMSRRALESSKKVVGKEHPFTLTSVSNLASVLQDQGKYEEAEQMNRRALDSREKVLGKQHPNTLTSVSNLASVLQDQGKYEEAEQINRRALESSEKVVGKEHPFTLMSVSNLALVLQDQGKYEEAEQMSRRALDGYKKVLGKEHPDTLTSVYCLAYLLQQQQRYHMAKPLYERALAGYRKIFQSHHPTFKACFEYYTSLLQELDEIGTVT